MRRTKSTVEISKELAIKLFAYAREAERSVDFAHLGPDQWALLRDYYGLRKQEALREIVRQLSSLIPPDPPLLERHQFEKGGLIRRLRLPIIRLANLTKLNWKFSRAEIIFIRQCFQYLIDVLPLWPRPPAQVLVNLRMDLFACECMIENHLYGLPELEKASRVEHFCQPDHIEHVTIDDLVTGEKTAAASTGAGAGAMGKTGT